MGADFGTIEKWVQLASNYGIPFVFTAVVLLIFIWVTIELVKLLKKWIPLWFETSIKSHERVCNSIDSLTESINCIHNNTHSTQEAALIAVKATNKHLNHPDIKQRLGLGSDLLIRFREVEQVLSNRDIKQHKHRPESKEEDNDGAS